MRRRPVRVPFRRPDAAPQLAQQEKAEDFVIATGRQESVRRFVELCGQRVGIAIRWEGAGVDERGIDAATGKTVVRVDPRYFRPAEVDTLLGDPTKAHAKLGWTPTTTLEELVDEMMASDLDHARREQVQRQAGFAVSASRE